MAARQLGQWKSLAAPNEEGAVHSLRRRPPATCSVGGSNFAVDRNLDKRRHHFINLTQGSDDKLFKVIAGPVWQAGLLTHLHKAVVSSHELTDSFHRQSS